MIDFTRIDHVSMAVRDLDAQAARFAGLFGLQALEAWTDEAEGSRGVTFALPAGANGDLRWELCEPARDDSPLHAFLEGPRGPGLHHVTFQVSDLEATRAELRRLGVREGKGTDERQVVVSADGAGEGLQLRFASHVSWASTGGDVTRQAAQPSLGIVALDHVCIAYPERDDLSKHLERLLGMRQIWRTPDGAWPDFGDCVLEVPGGQVHWEIIQPVGDDSFIRKFLDARGPAPHHVAFEVRDFDAALAACAEHDIPTFDEHDDETDGIRWRDAFIHPKYTGGLLTQIFWEAAPHVWERSDKVRPAGYTE